MKKTGLVMLLAGILLSGEARADLNIFLQGLNTQASANTQDYGMRLSNQFGVGLPVVHSLLRSVAVPADAFMCLQLGQMLGLPPERVLTTYQQNRGKGWGVVAQSLGIKPGSPEFHALKQGKFALTGTPAGHHGGAAIIDDQGGHGKGKGEGKDKGKGEGKGKGHNK